MICIFTVHGTPETLQLAIDALTTKIAEAAEKKYPTEPRLDPYPPNRSADGQFLVRVLIPRSSEGAMIGKGGAVVRQMTSETGCNFQLGNENDQYGTNERIFILTSPSVQGVVLGVNAVMHTLITSPKIRGYVNPGTAYGQAPSNQINAAPVPHAAPYTNGSSGYAPAPMLTAPGMVPYVQAPAPTVMYAPAPVVVGMPAQPLQYMQVPPQMAVPVPVQQVGAYPQAQQPAFQQPLGGHYQYNQGQQGQGQGREPVRHAGGPNGRGSHGGAGGSSSAHAQGQQQQQQQSGYNKYNNNNSNNNRYQQNLPHQQQQQQPVYAVRLAMYCHFTSGALLYFTFLSFLLSLREQQQAPALYQQQQPQMVVAGQYPAQQQPQYLYPSQPVAGVPQQQHQQQQQPHQQQGKVSHHQPQQQLPQQQAYGAPPAYQQQQQPQYATYPAAAGYPVADPSQQQQQMHLQYAVPVQQPAGVPHTYAPQTHQQQQPQQQYVQYGQQQQHQPAASQQYVYGAPASRK